MHHPKVQRMCRALGFSFFGQHLRVHLKLRVYCLGLRRCGVLGQGLSGQWRGRLAEVGEASLVVREVLPKVSSLVKALPV